MGAWRGAHRCRRYGKPHPAGEPPEPNTPGRRTDTPATEWDAGGVLQTTSQGAKGLTVALAGWVIGIPLGFALAHGLGALAENVFNEHVLFAFPLLTIPIVPIGTLILALLVMQIPLRRAVRFKPGQALRYA